jgi:hypothetical protein
MSITGTTHRKLLNRGRTHELPVCLESREIPVSRKSPCVSVSPVSNGHFSNTLKALATQNRATESVTARKALWKLLRDLKAVEKGIGHELRIDELTPVFDEWYRLSQPFVDPARTRDDYLAEFLAGLGRVRVPTGEGNTLNKALQKLSKLPDSDLPMIPDCPDAPRAWRRLAGLHREISRLCGGKVYFLSYRDAAEACNELDHQSAHTITLALARARVIDIVSKGKPGLKCRKAAEFRYLLPLNGEIDATASEEPAW